MDHKPFISFNDGTEMTYSDLKFKNNGEEYITIHFESPGEDDFKSMSIDYPGNIIVAEKGYSDDEKKYWLNYYEKSKDDLLDFAKEDYSA